MTVTDRFTETRRVILLSDLAGLTRGVAGLGALQAAELLGDC